MHPRCTGEAMARAELIAQADGMEWAHKVQGCGVPARIAELRAQAAETQETTPIVDGSKPYYVDTYVRVAELEDWIKHARGEAETRIQLRMRMQDRRIAELEGLLRRYRTETPLGHQPHMIAHKVDAALGEKT